MGILNNIRDIFVPVLSDKTILKYNEKRLLIEGNISSKQLQPNSVDLTLGRTAIRLIPNVKGVKPYNSHRIGTIEKIDTAREITYESLEFDEEDNGKYSYTIKPGEFVLMASKEVLNIPNGILSFVQGRSSIARLGIQTEQAGLIDAGFRGTITFEVYNQSSYPIKLYEGMRIAQVYFFKAQKALHPYGSRYTASKYYSQIEPTGSKINQDPELK